MNFLHWAGIIRAVGHNPTLFYGNSQKEKGIMYYVSTASSPQSAPRYSLLGLMYANQYAPQTESRDTEVLQQESLISHIDDLCDCV